MNKNQPHESELLRLQDVYDKDKQQKIFLTRAYIGALSVIAVLTIVTHGLTAYIANNQRESAGIVFTMTNLRSLAEVIVLQSAAYQKSGDAFDRQLLGQSRDKMKHLHLAIEAQEGQIKTLFHAVPYLLSQRFEEFINAAGELLRQPGAPGNGAGAGAPVESIARLEKSLTINLDMALEQYQSDIILQLAESFRLQYTSVFFILLVLFLEALFIFRPLVWRLDDYHKDLIRLALTDALTGLNNRRAFMLQAAAGVDYFNRHKKPFALVLTDLDKFKAVNDAYGHKVGDLVLQHYSKLMTQSFRSHDIVGRIGGEEFGIFLPETDMEEAIKIIERFRKTVMETPCAYVEKSGAARALHYTSSFGIAAVATGVWTMDALFIIADENLYKAKDQGRNCIVMKTLHETAT